jgi:pantoate--beta-alanine ligase
MKIVARAADLQALVVQIARSGRRIGLVPTMGNLHAGHHSLIDIARQRSDVVIASVFVNPTQFGPNEDFTRYPRTPESDTAGLAAHGCDVLFLPSVDDLYPHGSEHGVRVSVSGLDSLLEGAIRPGHFDGVATIVAKLFNLVRPDIAVFGQKDYQQLLVIRRLTSDMRYPIEIIGAPIVREANGLAMSSRNQYLSDEQRDAAGAIHSTLQWMAAEVTQSTNLFAGIESEAARRLELAGLVPDYAVIRRADDLLAAEPGTTRHFVALIAARIGATRLIDNFLIDL